MSNINVYRFDEKMLYEHMVGIIITNIEYMKVNIIYMLNMYKKNVEILGTVNI